MKIKAIFYFLFLINISLIAQTLSPGDIAIIGCNTDDPDDFSFVALVDLPSGTEIKFTDNGVYASGSFRLNEGAVQYIAPSSISAGTIITYSANSGNFSTVSGFGSGGFSFSTGGDQLIAFQGTSTTPTFIYAIQTYRDVWQSDATSANNSSLPSGLIEGETAIALGNASSDNDNVVYDMSVTTGTKQEILQAIGNYSNWTKSNTLLTMPTGSFTVTGGGTTIPDPPTATAATNITYESFTANWNASSGSTNYLLDVSENSDFSSFLPEFENKDVGNVLNYSVDQLNPSTPYYYRVRANNSAGTSNNSNVVEVITTDVPNTTVQFVKSSGIAAENSGTYNIAISILYPDAVNQTSVELVLISGDAADIGNYSTQTLTFPAGSSADQIVSITITDDGITEGNETLTFKLQNPLGGKSAAVGSPSQFNLTITEPYSGNYYDPISSGATGEQLRFELHNLIKGHIEYPYSSYTTDVWDILMDTDEDPENSNNVILIYTGRSQDKDYNASTYNDNVDAWNREHVWAKSRGDFGTEPPAGTDAHHLKPADASMNSTRSNKDFDDGGDQVFDNGTTATDCYTDTDSWEPRDEVKGDVARMLFYMDVRYEGGKGEPELYLQDTTYSLGVNDKPPTIGKLSTLLQWHQQDPPDPFEQRRNNVVYSYQQNRNPFIDHPEWVDSIWGTNAPISPTITNVTRNFNIPDADQDLVIHADIQDPDGSISLAEIRFNVDGGQYQQVSMTSGSPFSGTIPESYFDNGNLLSYYIYAEDNEGNPKYGTIQDLFTGITDIEKIHSVNSNGVLEFKSIIARIRGIATVGTNNFSTSSTDIYLQDETGGINIYKNSDITYSFSEGNDYTITGIISQYNGKTELIPENLSVDVVNNGSSTVPLPIVLTIDQLLQNPEVYEGMLVKINNISKVSGVWPSSDTNADLIVSDDGEVSTLTLRVDRDTDLDDNSEPTWPKDVTGIITQYDDFYPYNEKYQIQPRRMTDISNSVLVQIKIFLQGAYDSNTHEMKTFLNSSLPLISPYDGRKITEMPENIVDWVNVELRENPNGPAISSQSALLRKDGRIVNDDNSSVDINLPAENGQYYIVVKHRNHLAVMSSSAVQLNSTSSTLYDFTVN